MRNQRSGIDTQEIHRDTVEIHRNKWERKSKQYILRYINVFQRVSILNLPALRVVEGLLAILILIWFLLPQSVALAASDWYVRPAGGSYGSEDGTSYANAWDGLSNVVWGPGGVEAGDKLIISGTHIRTNTDRTQGIFTAGATGTADNPIVIKGNSGDPAIIWGTYIDERSGGMRKDSWTEIQPGVFYNESAIYFKAFDSYGLYENINGLNYDRYTILGSSQEVINSSSPGVYYLEPFGTNQHKVWLRPFKEATFKDNIYWSGHLGWMLCLNSDASYIEYRDITFIAGGIGHTSTTGSSTDFHHYTFTNCTFFAQGGHYIYPPKNASYITFENCEFAYCGEAIYVIWNRGPIHHLYVKNCYFHDIGKQSLSWTPDGHAIGIQNNEYFYLIGNRFERCGSGIVFHVGAVCTQRHCYVIGNYITDMRLAFGGGSRGGGIAFSGNNDCPKGNTGDMVVAYNVVTNCEGGGISTNRKDTVEIYNNVVYSCNGHYNIAGNRTDGASAKFYNNISLYPRVHVNVYTGKSYGRNHVFLNENYADIVYDFEADNNIYYPVGQDQGCFGFIGPSGTKIGATFKEWKEMNLQSGDKVDTYSFTDNPKLKNLSGIYENPSDFYPKQGSIAIDAGINVGLLEDFDGNPISYGAAPDIGAYEYGSALLKYDVNGDGYVTVSYTHLTLPTKA